MDITGAETLDELDRRGIRLVLARIRTSLRTTLCKLGLEDRLDFLADLDTDDDLA